jgi:hypothetical protein
MKKEILSLAVLVLTSGFAKAQEQIPPSPLEVVARSSEAILTNMAQVERTVFSLIQTVEASLGDRNDRPISELSSAEKSKLTGSLERLQSVLDTNAARITEVSEGVVRFSSSNAIDQKTRQSMSQLRLVAVELMATESSRLAWTFTKGDSQPKGLLGLLEGLKEVRSVSVSNYGNLSLAVSELLGISRTARFGLRGDKGLEIERTVGAFSKALEKSHRTSFQRIEFPTRGEAMQFSALQRSLSETSSGGKLKGRIKGAR